MIKENEVAFLKTTGEAVFVFALRDPSPKLGDKGLIADVRRPVAGQDGIKHVEETFWLAELESLDEQRARYMAESAKVLQKYGPKTSELPTTGDLGFSEN